ncbi:MAG: hypothetical protein J6M55_00605 [Paludibacteraceae bacterium]|nr:hypothetical protein [Paludibacteraceae bacterium]
MKKIVLCTWSLVTLSLVMASCTATRVVTTTASYVQHGDTTTTIMTKTTERYEGTRER